LSHTHLTSYYKIVPHLQHFVCSHLWEHIHLELLYCKTSFDSLFTYSLINRFTSLTLSVPNLFLNFSTSYM
jgi:hypothetical protein